MKSHFRFSKGQRNGIFLLCTLVVVLQVLYYYIEIPQSEQSFDQQRLAAFKHEIDSLKVLSLKNAEPKIYPFNPNYITDYRGYILGMTHQEIDRLHAYRQNNKFVNSAKEFQQVTKISDSLLAVISPYFKFPEWITNLKASYSKSNFDTPKSYDQKKDLNTATAKQLQGVNGIGEVLSERIVRFRSGFEGGFIDDIQLLDVYGLTPEVIQRLTNQFTVKTPRPITKIEINQATVEELVTIQHIDYELAHEIIDQRTLREGFKNLNELTKVKDFPTDKLEIIKLYLVLEKPN